MRPELILASLVALSQAAPSPILRPSKLVDCDVGNGECIPAANNYIRTNEKRDNSDGPQKSGAAKHPELENSGAIDYVFYTSTLSPANAAKAGGFAPYLGAKAVNITTFFADAVKESRAPTPDGKAAEHWIYAVRATPNMAQSPTGAAAIGGILWNQTLGWLQVDKNITEGRKTADVGKTDKQEGADKPREEDQPEKKDQPEKEDQPVKEEKPRKKRKAHGDENEGKKKQTKPSIEANKPVPFNDNKSGDKINTTSSKTKKELVEDFKKLLDDCKQMKARPELFQEKHSFDFVHNKTKKYVGFFTQNKDYDQSKFNKFSMNTDKLADRTNADAIRNFAMQHSGQFTDAVGEFNAASISLEQLPALKGPPLLGEIEKQVDEFAGEAWDFIKNHKLLIAAAVPILVVNLVPGVGAAVDGFLAGIFATSTVAAEAGAVAETAGLVETELVESAGSIVAEDETAIVHPESSVETDDTFDGRPGRLKGRPYYNKAKLMTGEYLNAP